LPNFLIVLIFTELRGDRNVATRNFILDSNPPERHTRAVTKHRLIDAFVFIAIANPPNASLTLIEWSMPTAASAQLVRQVLLTVQK